MLLLHDLKLEANAMLDLLSRALSFLESHPAGILSTDSSSGTARYGSGGVIINQRRVANKVEENSSSPCHLVLTINSLNVISRKTNRNNVPVTKLSYTVRVLPSN